MQDRIIRVRIVRATTYRAPDGTWHRDYPEGWEGPMKREHFERLSARGDAVAMRQGDEV